MIEGEMKGDDRDGSESGEMKYEGQEESESVGEREIAERSGIVIGNE